MLTSMTGFGRAVSDTPFGKLVVEVQSVNRKHLEIAVVLPRELSRFEPEVRKAVGDSISRGHVSLRVFLIPNATAIETLLPDLDTLRGFKKGWERLAQGLGIDPGRIDLPFLVTQLPQHGFSYLAEKKDLPLLVLCLKEALQALTKMRCIEGKALKKDLAQRLHAIQRELDQVEALAPEVVVRMRQRLAEKMREGLIQGSALDERLLREIALLAERVDIAEEITRLRSHLKQLDELIESKQTNVGRKMDFLVQEIGREINTIGSKCAEAKITSRVVEMKSELEKMREQIQNIE